MTLVLGFDIERSGGLREHHTIGIGASVVDENGKELDSLLLRGHMPSVTNFEKRCYDEFWSKHEDKLAELEYRFTDEHERQFVTREVTFAWRQADMIKKFQAFRRKWEANAKDVDLKLELASDNKSYDVCFLNEMIFDYCQDGGAELAMPYTASHPQTYSAFSETHSMARGLLMAIDPAFKGKGGTTARIAELYALKPRARAHTHNPVDDAYGIAYDMQMMYAIRDARVHLREE